MTIELGLIYADAYESLGIDPSRREQMVADVNHILKMIPESSKVIAGDIDERAWRLSFSTYFAEPDAEPSFLAVVKAKRYSKSMCGVFDADRSFFLEEIYDESFANHDIRSPMALAAKLLQIGTREFTYPPFLHAAVKEVVIIGTICREVPADKFYPHFEIKRDYEKLGFDSAKAKVLARETADNLAARQNLQRMLTARGFIEVNI